MLSYSIYKKRNIVLRISDCAGYNQNMDISHRFRLVVVALIVSLVVGCTPTSDAPLTVSPLNLKPYASATHAIFPSPTANATNIPLPSPTPSIYRVQAGDSLGTIAEAFGMHLADLQAANPGVVSESLVVGQKINIPVVASGVPVPAEAQVGPVTCHPAGAGTYCLVMVSNPFSETIENVKVQMSVLNAKGRVTDSQEAFLPLNILPPGSALPAYTLFVKLDPGVVPLAQLASSIRLTVGDQRYLPATVRNLLVSVDWDGRSARAQGQVALSDKAIASAGTIWLAAVAYNADKQIVGFRRWEWQGSLKPGKVQAFDFSVYSFGPAIETVDVVVEARP